MIKEQLDKFLYWIRERHSIFIKKEQGLSRPWTKDEILNTYKFTNPFRQNDRVTRELVSRLEDADDEKELFNRIIIFRMFNWPSTYDLLRDHGLVSRWRRDVAVRVLQQYKKDGGKVFTGAYMMTGSGSSGEGGKIATACNSINLMLHDANSILKQIHEYNTLQHACQLLTKYPIVADFVAYEFVTDMRHTSILNKAEDIYTWANPGPGAKRGIHRILFGTTRGTKLSGEKVDYQAVMQELMNIAQKRLGRLKIFQDTRFEMRDIEHSLCEFDKYMRVYNGEGKPRSKYRSE